MIEIRKLSLAEKRGLKGYLFILPFLIGFLFLFLSPLLLYINMGFSEMRPGNGEIIFTGVGLDNYKELFLKDQSYIQAIFASIGKMLFTFPTVLIFSFFVAIVLNQKFKGRTFIRAVFFLPVVIASGVALVISSDISVTDSIKYLNGTDNQVQMINIMRPIYRVFFAIFGDLGIDEIISDIIAEIYSIAIASGVQILVFLAGLQTISPSLYEASSIEGATGWENFWKITLPMISPMILVNAVYTLIDALAGPTNEMIDQIYTEAMVNQNHCMSAAMGILYFTISIVILTVVVLIINKFVFYENG